jgi:hypothetical protein
MMNISIKIRKALIMFIIVMPKVSFGQDLFDSFQGSYKSHDNQFINETHFINCRTLVLNKYKDLISNTNDTIIFAELFTDVNGTYDCGLYLNNELCCYSVKCKTISDSVNYEVLPIQNSNISNYINIILNGNIQQILKGANSNYSPPKDLVITMYLKRSISSYIVKDVRACL